MIQEKLKEELKEAMKAKDSLKMGVIRNMLSSFTNELVASGKTPHDNIDDDAAMGVIKRLVKQRKDSIEQFEKGGRPELAEDEKAELVILETYLPEMMSLEEIEKMALAKKMEMGIEDKAKMGILIGAVMKDAAGKADGGDVKRVVERLF